MVGSRTHPFQVHTARCDYPKEKIMQLLGGFQSLSEWVMLSQEASNFIVGGAIPDCPYYSRTKTSLMIHLPTDTLKADCSCLFDTD